MWYAGVNSNIKSDYRESAYGRGIALIQKAGNQSALRLWRAGERETVLQRETDLQVQIGPSCWLFVLEALLKSQGTDTKMLRIIMNSYATSGEVMEKKLKLKMAGEEKSDRRVVALLATKDKLVALLQKINNYPQERKPISKDVVIKMINRAIGSDRIKEDLIPNDSVNITDLKKNVEESIYRLNGIIEAISSNEEGSDISMLLNMGCSVVDSDQDLDDVKLTLSVMKFPCYMSVRKIFKKLDTDSGEVVDFRNRDRNELVDTSHALLLISYSDSEDLAEYKNPNYGNVIFQVSIAQIRDMAGNKELDEKMQLFSYIPEGNHKSTIATILKEPMNSV